MFTSQFFLGNRQKLLSKLPTESVVVVTANGLLQRSGDVVYPFRQDSNFYYLTGLGEPDLVLVCSQTESFVILPRRTAVEDIFGGSLSQQAIIRTSGVDSVYDNQAGWARLKQLLVSSKRVSTLGAPPVRVTATDSFFTNPARRHLTSKLKRLRPGVQLVDIRSELVQLRQVKQAAEIAAIQQAIDLTGKGLAEVRSRMQPGMYEYEIQAMFDYVFRAHDADHGFSPPIVASGQNACVIHHIGGGDALGQGELLLLDIGAEIAGYTADISRTYVVGTNAMTERQTQVIQAVTAVSQSMIQLLKPGITWQEYARAADQAVGEALIQLGLITVNQRSNVRPYFPHAIGHSLGLDAHDVCDYRQPILEGMVLTVEPGIYIPNEGIGVRIEDDILITKTGCRNLSAKIV